MSRLERPHNWATARLFANRVLNAKKAWEAIHASEGGKPRNEWSPQNRNRARELHRTANRNRQRLTEIGWSDMAAALLANNYATSKVIVQSMINRAQNAAQAGIPERPRFPEPAPDVPEPAPDAPKPATDFPEIKVIKKYLPWVVAGIIGLKILRRF